MAERSLLPPFDASLPLPTVDPSRLHAVATATDNNPSPLPLPSIEKHPGALVAVSCWSVMEQGEPTTVSVMLIVSDAVRAVGWYTEALGAEVLWDLGGVAALSLQGAPFLVHEAVPGKVRESSPTDAGLTTTRIEVFVDAPEDLVDRASGAGASDVEPVSDHDTPWGTHRQGGFTDPFGHRWSVGDQSPLRALSRLA